MTLMKQQTLKYEAINCAIGLKKMLDKNPLLFGNNHDKLFEIVDTFNILGNPKLIAEIALLENSGYDLSIKFGKSDEFLTSKENFSSLFDSLYSNRIEGVPYYLEFDTFSRMERYKQPALFLTLENKPIEYIYMFLNIINEKERAKRIKNFCTEIFPHLIPVHIGIFNDRINMPIRLTCKFSSLTSNLEKILREKFDHEVINGSFEILNNIFASKLFYRFAFDFDLLENGQLGKRISYEFKINQRGPQEKRKFLHSKEWNDFCNYLIYLGIADKRIFSLEKCISTDPIEGSTDLFCSISISHFKISWNNGRMEPLKVYIKSKCIDSEIFNKKKQR